MALLLESAWQDREARRAEVVLLESLRDEFASNGRSLDRWLELHRRIAVSTRAAIDLLSGGSEGTAVSVPDSILAETVRTPTYGPELGSLDAALNSGRIALIRSSEIQRALARWSRLLADAQEEEVEGSHLVDEQLLPYLGRVTELGSALGWLASDVERVMQSLPPGDRPSTASSVITSRELVNLLWVRFRLANAAASELGIFRTSLDDLVELLGGTSE